MNNELPAPLSSRRRKTLRNETARWEYEIVACVLSPRVGVCTYVCVCARPNGIHVHTHACTHTTIVSFRVVSFLAVARYLIFASSPLCRGENRRKLNAHDNKGPVCTYIHAVRDYCPAYRAMLVTSRVRHNAFMAVSTHFFVTLIVR